MNLKTLFTLCLLLLFKTAPAQAHQTTAVLDMSQVLQLQQLMDKVVDEQVLFVGETHDRYDHHLNQLAIIQNQFRHHPDLVIGLEFIQQPFQSVLDDYIGGKIDEPGLLEGTQYFERWGFDFRLYRPIFTFARDNGIPLLALNLDKKITEQVKKDGLESLDKEQRQQIPSQINRDDAHYNWRIKDIFMQHPGANEKDFGNFLDVQLLWDEGMAERAAAWFEQHPDGHMVILAGAGHIAYGSGIPDRFSRRSNASTATVINASGSETLLPDIADYVIMSEPQTLPPSGMLGVMLDIEQTPPSVSGFAKTSGAHKAGIKKDDQIVRIGNNSIHTYADIRFALMDTKPGDSIQVEVNRKGVLSGSKELSYEVVLK